jgi:putative tributyrin esterase
MLYRTRYLAIAFILFLISCGKSNPPQPPDRPRITPDVKLVDVSFHSAALNREMPYRVVLPAKIAPGEKLPVLYLLHGAGGGFHDWSNETDVARFAAQHLILIMPEGDDSYYVNAAGQPQDRYEDYIVHDLIADVEGRFPVAPDRAHRTIAGVSMGGFGAVLLALKHPDLFLFAGGLSSALDAPSRPFSMKRIGQWRHYRSIFGPSGSEHHLANDPFVVARSADPAQASSFFLTCGEQEGLLPANKKFAALLEQRHFRYEFHSVAGGHDWNQWNSHVPDLIKSLIQHLGR